MKPKMITRVTTTEFETDDGVIHDIPFRPAKRKRKVNQNETRNLAWRLFRTDEGYSR